MADIPSSSSSHGAPPGATTSTARPAPERTLGPKRAVRTERPAGSEGATGTKRPAGAERALGAELAAPTAPTAVTAVAAVAPWVVVSSGVSSPAAARVSCMARAERVAAAVSGGAEAVRTEVDVVAMHRSSPLRWVDVCMTSDWKEVSPTVERMSTTYR